MTVFRNDKPPNEKPSLANNNWFEIFGRNT